MLVIDDSLILDCTVQKILVEMKYQLILNNSLYVPQYKDSGNDIMMNCPFHKDGRERKPSFGIEKTTGVGHCFTCGYSAQLPEFISNVFGKDDLGLFGAYWLRKNFDSVAIEERGDIDIDFNRKQTTERRYNYVPDIVLNQYRVKHDYMYKRRLTDEVIDLFDIGYDDDTDCITFPIRDFRGNCLYVARRSVTGKFFSYPKSTEKPLYGLYELTKCDSMLGNYDLYVTESMINCLTLWTYGLRAVALNGTGSSQQLYDLLKLPHRSIVLALDPDVAGRTGTNKIADYLKDAKVVYKIEYKEEGKDINDLSQEEFYALNKVFA